jgi:predicted DNA-binding ribbon-helix-helix protein
MRNRKRLSKKKELVSKRKEIGFRPEKSLYKQVERISKRRGVSMNQVVNELVENGINEKGVNTLARI